MSKVIIFKTKEGVQIEVEVSTSFVFGRSDTCDRPIPDQNLSREHARVELNSDGNVLITDLNSKNGLSLNKKKSLEIVLNTDDIVEAGQTTIFLKKTQKINQHDQAQLESKRPHSPQAKKMESSVALELFYRSAIIKRAAAFSIDATIINLLVSVLILFVPALSPTIFSVGLTFFLLAFRDTNIIFSFGKKLAGLKVVNDKMATIDTTDHIKRNLLFIIPFSPVLEFFIAFLDKKEGKRIGDKIANSRVHDLYPERSGFQVVLTSTIIDILLIGGTIAYLSKYNNVSGPLQHTQNIQVKPNLENRTTGGSYSSVHFTCNEIYPEIFYEGKKLNVEKIKIEKTIKEYEYDEKFRILDYPDVGNISTFHNLIKQGESNLKKKLDDLLKEKYQKTVIGPGTDIQLELCQNIQFSNGVTEKDVKFVIKPISQTCINNFNDNKFMYTPEGIEEIIETKCTTQIQKDKAQIEETKNNLVTGDNLTGQEKLLFLKKQEINKAINEHAHAQRFNEEMMEKQKGIEEDKIKNAENPDALQKLNHIQALSRAKREGATRYFEDTKKKLQQLNEEYRVLEEGTKIQGQQ